MKKVLIIQEGNSGVVPRTRRLWGMTRHQTPHALVSNPLATKKGTEIWHSIYLLMLVEFL